MAIKNTKKRRRLGLETSGAAFELNTLVDLDAVATTTRAIASHLARPTAKTEAAVLAALLGMAIQEAGLTCPTQAERRRWPAIGVKLQDAIYAAVPDPAYFETPVGEGRPGNPRIMRLVIQPAAEPDKAEPAVDFSALLGIEMPEGDDVRLNAPPSTKRSPRKARS